MTVDGQLSDVLPVNVGVPQGSILGPSYASKWTTDLERNINEDLVYLKEYLVINKLSLNI